VRRFPDVFGKLRRGARASLLFLEADERALVRRFSETRRPHPWPSTSRVIEGIRERARGPPAHPEDGRPHRRHLLLYRPSASRLRARALCAAGRRRAAWSSRSCPSATSSECPAEADLVFDLRFLPNPNFVPRLKPLTGQHPQVVGLSQPASPRRRSSSGRSGACSPGSFRGTCARARATSRSRWAVRRAPPFGHGGECPRRRTRPPRTTRCGSIIGDVRQS